MSALAPGTPVQTIYGTATIIDAVRRDDDTVEAYRVVLDHHQKFGLARLTRVPAMHVTRRPEKE